MSRIANLKVKIFADGADFDGMVKMARNPAIKGFTTNPSLMRKAGVNDYETFARRVLAAIGHALAFGTWRSLAHEQELTDSQAADLMCRLVAAAAGRSARRRATERNSRANRGGLRSG